MNRPDSRIIVKEDRNCIPRVFVDGKELASENAISVLKALLLDIEDEEGRELLKGTIKKLRESFN